MRPARRLGRLALFVLDTDVLSNLRKARPQPALLAWLAPIPPDQTAITAISVMELIAGVEQVRRTDPTAAARIGDWVDGMLRNALVLPLDAEAARLLGHMHATPALRNFLAAGAGQPQTGADLAIAAIAITNAATLVTGNFRDFARIDSHFPLPGLHDPFTGRAKKP